MQKVDELLSDYAAFHQTRGNVVCHFIGIPLIIFGMFSMLQLLHLGPITGAEILLLVSTLYYFTLDARLAMVMLVAASGLDALAFYIADYRIGLAVFILGWIFQGIGHSVYEKKSPAFLRNLVHLMVGPIFLVNEACHFRSIHRGEPSKA